ncbi:hypothetical protein WBG78_27260 [Chryseolinea sp. T2]|uniref:hypothetical protein n=1 Tax=Chryseolinea sp. T2 TaxID=3129255 RepID=UPI003077AE9E
MIFSKIQLFKLSVICCLIVPAVSAQPVKDEISIIEGGYGLQKRQLVAECMKLSNDEATAFWRIYDKYENERRKLGEERLMLTHDYIIAYPLLTAEQSSSITLRCFRNDEELWRLHKKYYKQIRRSVSPMRAAQFVQLENYLQHVVRVDLQNKIPFIGEIADSELLQQ